MNRRYFFQQLASGLVAAVAPSLFLPKLIKPGWKQPYRPKARWVPEEEQQLVCAHNLDEAEGVLTCFVSFQFKHTDEGLETKIVDPEMVQVFSGPGEEPRVVRVPPEEMQKLLGECRPAWSRKYTIGEVGGKVEIETHYG